MSFLLILSIAFIILTAFIARKATILIQKREWKEAGLYLAGYALINLLLWFGLNYLISGMG